MCCWQRVAAYFRLLILNRPHPPSDSSVLLENIELISATDDKREFKVSANVPMTKTGFYEAICRASNQQLRCVEDGWVLSLGQCLLPRSSDSCPIPLPGTSGWQ